MSGGRVLAAFRAAASPAAESGPLPVGPVLIELVSEDREVLALVPTPEAPARRDGAAAVFMVCCGECAESLKAAVANDKGIAAYLVDIEELPAEDV